jgi:translation initiation factor IF-1
MDVEKFSVGVCVSGVVEEALKGKGCHIRCSPGVKVWGSRTEMVSAEEGDRVKVVVTKNNEGKINVSERKFEALKGSVGGTVELGDRKGEGQSEASAASEASREGGVK